MLRPARYPPLVDVTRHDCLHMQEPSPPPLAPPAPMPIPQRGFNLHNMETLEAALQEAMQVLLLSGSEAQLHVKTWLILGVPCKEACSGHAVQRQARLPRPDTGAACMPAS